MDFKLEDNIPNVYIDESRDFQLLCRVLDIYLKGVLNQASYIPYQLNLDKCSEQLLYAIANMQGFVTNKYIPPEILRNICKVFPYCIKRKGTIEAIRVAAYAVLSVDKLIYYVNVTSDSYIGDDIETPILDNYIITITCNSQSEYIPYLEELLRFLVPAGWKINYQLLNTVSRILEPTETTTQTKIAKLSGITGKIMSISPLIFDLFGSEINNLNTKTGMYSKIGFAKIIKSRTKDALRTQLGATTNSSGFTTIDLIDTNGQTMFIGNKNINFNPEEGGE